MSQSYTTRTVKGSSLTWAQLDANFNVLGTLSSVRFGSFGVGTTETGTSGDIRNTGQILSSGNITAYYSDDRLKTKIGPIENALDKIMTLEGFYYTENDVAKTNGYLGEGRQVGLSAQSVQAILPEVVKPAPFDCEFKDGKMYSASGENYLTIQYEKLIPLLVQSIKELNSELINIKNRLTTYENLS